MAVAEISVEVVVTPAEAARIASQRDDARERLAAVTTRYNDLAAEHRSCQAVRSELNRIACAFEAVAGCASASTYLTSLEIETGLDRRRELADRERDEQLAEAAAADVAKRRVREPEGSAAA